MMTLKATLLKQAQRSLETLNLDITEHGEPHSVYYRLRLAGALGIAAVIIAHAHGTESPMPWSLIAIATLWPHFVYHLRRVFPSTAAARLMSVLDGGASPH
jgi:hypothetical protein